MDEVILLISDDIFVDFYMYVKINFQYRKKKNPFLIHQPFQNVCLWAQNTELEGRYAFQV